MSTYQGLQPIAYLLSSVDHVLGPIYLFLAHDEQFRASLSNSHGSTEKFLLKHLPLFERGNFAHLIFGWIKFNAPLLPGSLTKKKNQKLANVHFDAYGNLMLLNASLQPVQSRRMECRSCSHTITLWENESKPLSLTHVEGNNFRNLFDQNMFFSHSHLIGNSNCVHTHCDLPMLQIMFISENNSILFIDLDSLTSNSNNTHSSLDHFQGITIGNTSYEILAIIHSTNSHFTTTFQIHGRKMYYDDQTGLSQKIPHLVNSRLAAAIYVKI